MERMKSLHELGQHVASEQDAALERMDLESVKQQLLQRELDAATSGRSLERPLLVGAGLALSAAAAVFLVLKLSGPEQPSQLQVSVGGAPVAQEALDNWWSAPAHAALPIEFSDGTKVGLKPSSRARMLQVGENGAHIVLESGASSVQVVPRESSQWQVSAGPFLVQVVGTSFDIEWQPDEDLFVLKLHKGEVNLSGCLFGNGRSVVAGETVRAYCKSREYEIATRDSLEREPKVVPARGPEPDDSADDQAPSDVAGSSVVRVPGWRTLARDGKYKEAIAAATAAGFGDELGKASAEDLGLLGDAARYSGRPSQAIAAYEKLRARYPGTGRAATAAYSLARTHFDQQGAYGQAARWFQIYLNERPSGPLAREARGRLMESLSLSGDDAGARRLAESYLKRYPSGPHAALARSLTKNRR